MMRAYQTCYVEVGRETNEELTSAQFLPLLEILTATLLEPNITIILNLNQPTALHISPSGSPSFLLPGGKPPITSPRKLVVPEKEGVKFMRWWGFFVVVLV